MRVINHWSGLLRDVVRGCSRQKQADFGQQILGPLSVPFRQWGMMLVGLLREGQGSVSALSPEAPKSRKRLPASCSMPSSHWPCSLGSPRMGPNHHPHLAPWPPGTMSPTASWEGAVGKAGETGPCCNLSKLRVGTVLTAMPWLKEK